MKRNRLYLVALVILALVLATIACGGGTQEPPTPEPTDAPPPTPEPEPTEEPLPPTEEPTGDMLDWSLDPNFGEVELEAGFLPDPNTFAVVSGGPVDASYISGCGGYATANPDLRLFYTSSSPTFMRIFFVPDEAGMDSTLIISAPDGSWYCNDDAFGLDPAVDFAAAETGQYDIWIGSFSPDDFIGGTLGVTEFDADPIELLGGGGVPTGDVMDWGLEPNFGEVDLVSGFTPDPYGVEVVSGGGLFAGDSVEGCNGYVTANPDLWFYWDGTGFLRIYFEPDTPGDDTTLIINDANADWYCNDDAFGLNPAVDFADAPSGWYAIWVGSFGMDELISGTVYFTELESNP
jgi:serine protease Do